uniref:leucine-rich repeat domain-containing protein n=1 Tax=Eubacterium cellulosolvens TaxID=29322 RepID=UPI000A5030D8|nr:leucine-rich repeat domain-containing protein [[Eubacterium] cellulosolvens]
MGKKKILAVIATCLLVMACPYVVTAGEVGEEDVSVEMQSASGEEQDITVEEQDGADEVYGSPESVICSGDCSASSRDNVKWRVVKTEDGELKLIVSGTGRMFDTPLKSELRYTGVYDYYVNGYTLLDRAYEKLKKINAYKNSYIEEVEICEGVLNVGNGAFSDGKGCGNQEYRANKITWVILPDGLSEIGNRAFSTSMEWIYIPRSVTRLGSFALQWYGESLVDVYYEGTYDEYRKISQSRSSWGNYHIDGQLSGHPRTDFHWLGLKKKQVAMQRLYNSFTKEHFYTTSTYERDVLYNGGWKYEGVGWYAPVKSGTPVYRLYNPFVRDHHYTTDAHEKDVLSSKYGWKYEGIGWYSDDSKGVPLYRRYCPGLKTGAHHYTKDSGEAKHLVKVGWRDEGIAWYGQEKKD